MGDLIRKEKYTWDYFLEEHLRFREVSGSRKYTFEQLEEAFKGLMFVALNCAVPEDKKDMLTSLVQAISLEHQMRQRYRVMLTEKEGI